MTDLILLNELSIRLKSILQDDTYPAKHDLFRSVKIFRQYLPQPSGITAGSANTGIEHYSTNDYESNFPCIILRHNEHIDKEEGRLDMSRTNIKLITGIYDDKAECTGWEDLMIIADKIRENLLENRVVSGRFVLEMPLKHKLLDPDTWPVFFGEMDLWFTIPRPVLGKDRMTKEAVI